MTDAEILVGIYNRAGGGWSGFRAIADAILAAPTTCPACDGAGIVDTSPPGVDRAPWLQTDTDCAACGGSGEISDTDTEES